MSAPVPLGPPVLLCGACSARPVWEIHAWISGVLITRSCMQHLGVLMSAVRMDERADTFVLRVIRP